MTAAIIHVVFLSQRCMLHPRSFFLCSNIAVITAPFIIDKFQITGHVRPMYVAIGQDCLFTSHVYFSLLQIETYVLKKSLFWECPFCKCICIFF